MVFHRALMGYQWGYANGWMVFVRENPSYKWRMTGGAPILGNLHVCICAYVGDGRSAFLGDVNKKDIYKKPCLFGGK